jgi:hypothetical protein
MSPWASENGAGGMSPPAMAGWQRGDQADCGDAEEGDDAGAAVDRAAKSSLRGDNTENERDHTERASSPRRLNGRQ